MPLILKRKVEGLGMREKNIKEVKTTETSKA
jgi:hypothetical protein